MSSRGACSVRLRTVPIFEGGAERLLERAKLCLERPPLVGRLLADRLTDLLGARAAHRALRLMEIEAGLVEWYADIVEEPANFRFGLLDQPFVRDPMYPGRRQAVEMSHQPHIVGVMPAEVPEIIGEFLAPCVELLEVRKPAGQRVAPRVDDLGVGQDQTDETDVHPVVRHFVDEEGPVGLALDARTLEVERAQLAKLL